MKLRKYEITWRDFTILTDKIWHPIGEIKRTAIKEMHPLKAIGYLLFKNKHYIWFTTGIGYEDHYSTPFCVPRGCIMRMRRLK